MIYSQNRKISASLCGTDAKLSAIGILNLVEDSLTELTGALNIDGLTTINKYGAILVFFRNHVKIFQPAAWNDTVVVTSFISSISVIRFCIDTCIKSLNGEMIAYARIELCAIDLATKRIRKMETVGLDSSAEVEEALCEIEFQKKQKQDLPFLENVVVKSSNIDYVHHTNNIEYIRFLMNTFTVSELETHPLKELEINYANQTFEGDCLALHGLKDSGKAIFEIRKEEQPVLKCEMHY